MPCCARWECHLLIKYKSSIKRKLLEGSVAWESITLHPWFHNSFDIYLYPSDSCRYGMFLMPVFHHSAFGSTCRPVFFLARRNCIFGI